VPITISYNLKTRLRPLSCQTPLCQDVMEFKRFGVNSTPTHRMDRAYAHSVSGGSLSSGSTSGTLAITNEKTTMQHLNDRLANYLETVRSLEKANSLLEIKIRESSEEKGPMKGRDFSKYNATIMELRDNIFTLMKDNAHLSIAHDNASLASDDFRMKMEYEMCLRQTVEADVARLRKLLDDINIVRLHLEGDIESLKEELIYLRKNHKTDVAELHAQITQVGVRVDIDAPKGQDLARIMDEMRAKYEKIALKNQEELKRWHETQITEVQVQVTESSTALKEATTVISDSRRTYHTLDIEMQAGLSLKASLEATLHDIEMRFNMEVEKYNEVILRLQEELTHIRTDIQHNTTEYEHLLNIKVKLEAEISEYRRLLDGEANFTLEDAVDSKVVQTKVVTVTQTLVDGKVVSKSKDIKSSSKVAGN
uniref:Keratin 18a, tandem duplicate 2 n=1 Tax=Cyclopterus lumpus TaxID=8103 RepID=A0A8C2X7L9_CYCLU